MDRESAQSHSAAPPRTLALLSKTRAGSFQGGFPKKGALNGTEAVESLLSEDLEALWSRLPIMTKGDLQRPLS